MGDCFIRALKILDSWESSGEKFRLVNYGAGPDGLEVNHGDGWEEERACYRWGVLACRVKWLSDNCLKEVFNRLRNDEGLYIGWKANIAMAFVDEYERQRKSGQQPDNDIHKIANEAAKNFLNLLTRE